MNPVQSPDAAAPARERTFTWEDPWPALARASRMSGLEAIRAVAAGELPKPPLGAALDFTIPEVEEGRVVFAADAAEWMMNPLGTVHGGVVATMLDSAVGSAVQTTLEAGTGYTTLELKVNFVRAVSADAGTLLAEGRVIHRGGTIATAEGWLRTESGRLLAHATTTCLILKPR